MNVEPIKQQTIVAQIMDEIRKLIASGAYNPGDKIPTEKELSERFRVGRSSIREAIKIFNYLGVLESRAALGTFVQERSNISTEALTWSLLLGNDELHDVIDFRGSIELWCLLKLVDGYRKLDDAAITTINELKNIILSMQDAVKEGNRQSLIDDDFNFHQTIIRSSNTPLFLSIYRTLKSFLQDEIRKSQEDYEDISLIATEHDQLLRTIMTGKPYEIMADYMDHIENIKNRLKSKD